MREYSAREHKLLEFMGSLCFFWGMTLFFALLVLNDYYHRQFSWIDGILVGAWGFRMLMELTALILYRRRKDTPE